MNAREWLATHSAVALTLDGECSLEEAARLLLDHPEERDIFVLDAQKRVRGHLGFRDVAALLLAELRPTHTRRELIERITLGSVAEHMDDRVLCAQADEAIDEVFHRHMEQRIEDIPVVDEHRRLLGVIRVSDLLREAVDSE